MTDTPTPRRRNRGGPLLGVLAALPFTPFVFTLLTGGGFSQPMLLSGLAVLVVGAIILAITVVK